MKAILVGLILGFSTSAMALPVVKVELEGCPTVMNGQVEPNPWVVVNSFIEAIRRLFTNPSMMN